MKRVVKSNEADSSSATILEYNRYAGAQKQIDGGAVLEILGPLNVAKNVAQGATVYCYNNSASTAFVRTYPHGATPVAPTGISDGIAIPPNSYMVINMWEDCTIIASAATVGGYKLKDDTKLSAE